MPGILWLASYPKSGNTWMRAFVANFIDGGGEPLPLDHISGRCPGITRERWFKPIANKPVRLMSEIEVASLREKAQQHAVASTNFVIPMKTHSWLGQDHGYPVHCMDATAGAIYIVRDPRDVAVSGADHFGWSLDKMIRIMSIPEHRATPMRDDRVNEVWNTWSSHVQSWTQCCHPRFVAVRYEDLLADPFGEFRMIACRVDLTQDETQIRRAVGFSSFKVLRKLEEKHGFSERVKNDGRFFRKGEAGGWREVLTAKQARRIELDHAEQMERFDYL